MAVALDPDGPTRRARMRSALLAALMMAAFTWGGCGSVKQTTGSDDSVAPSQPVPETNSGDSSSWETARQSQDDPSSVKSAEDIAGNCVKDVGSKALMIRPLRAMPKLAPFL